MLAKCNMNSLIEAKRTQLEELCRRYRVRRIELFGSAAKGVFDSDKSDLDFLVTFQDLQSGQFADAYFGLLEGLQGLFGRPVDLVTASSIQNPYFLQTVEKTRTLIYAD